MEAEGRYTFVGATVLLVLAALVGAVIWLSGGADRAAYRNYAIYFKQQSMDGLAIGSAVKMRGIKVGTVDSYHFDEAEAVRVVVRVDADVPVRATAQAYVKRSLVTGLAAIEIANRDASSPLLAAASAGERYPVIAEGSSDLDKVATTVTRLTESGAVLLERMNDLLSDDNRQALSATLVHMQGITGHLDDSKKSLDAAVQGIRDASDEFRFAGASIAQAATHADASIAGLGQRADDALRETALAMIGLQQETTLISGQIQALSQAGGLELMQTSRDVRASADALLGAGQTLANPRAQIFAPSAAELGPGEGQP